jgi:hypothetical protein
VDDLPQKSIGFSRLYLGIHPFRVAIPRKP